MNDHDDIYRLENEPVDRHGRGAQHEPSDGSRSPYQPAPRFSVRCVRCGYDLVGLTVGSYCPECGHQVGLGGGMDAPSSGFAVASLVMGILSLLSCSFYGVPALVFGPLAIWFAAKAKAQVHRGEAAPSSLGLATAGRITGIIGLSISAAILILFVVLFAFMGVGFGIFP